MECKEGGANFENKNPRNNEENSNSFSALFPGGKLPEQKKRETDNGYNAGS